MQPDYLRSTDAQIWEEFRSGSRGAYSYIYTKYAPILYNYGYKIARDRGLVEDCIQDLFIVLLSSRQNLSGTDSIKFYLFKAIRREILQKLEKRNRQSAYLTVNTDDSFEITFSHETLLIETQASKERTENLLKELNQLPARQKEAIFLKFYDNLSYEEIASIMGIEQSSVYKIIYKAIDMLQKKVAYVSLLLLLLFLISTW